MNSLYMNNNKVINKNNTLEWKISAKKILYSDAVRIMEDRVKNIHNKLTKPIIPS